MLRYVANYSQHECLLIIAIYHECVRFVNDFYKVGGFFFASSLEGFIVSKAAE